MQFEYFKNFEFEEEKVEKDIKRFMAIHCFLLQILQSNTETKRNGFNGEEEVEDTAEKHLSRSVATDARSGHCDAHRSILLFRFCAAALRLVRHRRLGQGGRSHRHGGRHQLPPPLPALHLHTPLHLQVGLGRVVRGGGGLGHD